MVLVIQSYHRLASGVTRSVEKALRALKFDYADVLLLGYRNGPLPARIRAACLALRERGLVRHIALSTHNRPVIAQLARDPDIDLFHVRYNAVHTGAERDVFPHLPAENPPGIVSFTATSWKQLLDPRRVPAGERVPTAGRLLPVRPVESRRGRLPDWAEDTGACRGGDPGDRAEAR